MQARRVRRDSKQALSRQATAWGLDLLAGVWGQSPICTNLLRLVPENIVKRSASCPPPVATRQPPQRGSRILPPSLREVARSASGSAPRRKVGFTEICSKLMKLPERLVHMGQSPSVNRAWTNADGSCDFGKNCRDEEPGLGECGRELRFRRPRWSFVRVRFSEGRCPSFAVSPQKSPARALPWTREEVQTPSCRLSTAKTHHARVRSLVMGFAFFFLFSFIFFLFSFIFFPFLFLSSLHRVPQRLHPVRPLPRYVQISPAHVPVCR